MWNKQKFINDDWFGEAGWFGLEDYNETIQDSYLIQSMFFDEGDGEAEADWMVSLNSTTTGKSFGITGTPEELSILNSLLQDNYKIVSPDINESEDEFSVEAPKDWNVETLTVGDYITPDMYAIFSRYLSYNKFQHESSKILRFADDETGETMVTLEFKDEDYSNKYGNEFKQRSVVLKSLNSVLKPEYKIVEFIDESNDGDFTVDAPKEWNIQTLYDGDLITPDMWNRENLSKVARLKNYIYDPDQDWTVIAEDDPNFIIIKSNGGVKIMFKKDTVNSLLKPEYQLDVPINESDDEFNVKAPTKWNKELLTVGDDIEPHMWDLNNVDLYDYIDDPNENWIIDSIDERMEIQILTLSGGETWCRVDDLNGVLKPEYQIVRSLTESEDEFNVDAPQGWNVIELTVGNTITPDMIQDQIHDKISRLKGGDRKLGFKILDIKDSDDGAMVRLQMLNSTRLPVYWNIKTINDKYLKPQFKVVPSSFNINESEDEFSVNVPQGWDVIDLGVGDYIAPEMIDVPKNKRQWDNFHRIFADPKRAPGWKINKFFFTSERGVYVRLEYRGNWHDFRVDFVNEYLKPQYKISPSSFNITESEDEFNVEAPKEWNVTELTVGDTITSNMIKDSDIFGWKKDGTDYKIIEFAGSGLYEDYFKIKYKDSKGIKTGAIINLEIWNKKVLKSKYQLVRPLTESDEFNVEAPKEWNQEYLTAGDTITPDMWDVSKLATQLKYYFKKPVKISRIGYSEFDDEELELLVNIDLGIDSGEYFADFDINHVNDLLKPQYKVVQNKALTEEEDDFAVDAPTGWNYELLTIGDVITPDMWDDDVNNMSSIKEFNKVLKKPFIIKDISRSDLGGNIHYLITLDNDVHIHSSFLKPQYKVVSDLNESEDDFTVDAPEDWNVQELGVGDYLDSSNLKMQNYSKKYEIVEIIKNRFGNLVLLNVYELVEKPIPGTIRINKQWETYRQSRIEISDLESKMKPGFKIDVSGLLNESLSKLLEVDDEWSVTVPDKWNEIQLTIGDQITPDMWDEKAVIDAGEEDEFLNGKIWTINILVNEWVQMSSDGGDDMVWGVKSVQSLLKSEYKIVKNKLNESEEDEFSVEAPDKWDESQLTIGDQITPDMWDLQAVMNAGVDGFFLNDEIWTISNIVSRWIQLSSDKFGHLDRINDIQALLKPQYQIVKNMNESDDEFSVEAPEKWNKILLTKGDYITPDMWRKIPNRFANPPQSVEIGGFGLVGDADDIKTVRLIKSDMSHVAYSFPYDDLNNELLKPQYQIVHPIDGNNKWKDLYEENESEDEFTVDAPKDWNIDYLGIGDTITPDMWNKRETKYVTGLSFNKPLKISWIGTDGISGFIEFEGYKSDYLDVEFIHDLLKPQYRIGLSKLNEEDEDFTVNAPEEWNVQELGIGDKITKDMIKNPEFLNQMVEDFEMDFPGVITKIYKTSGNENWGVRIRFQDVGWRKYLPKSKDIKLGLGFDLDSFNDNNLKPQYKIKEPVFELSTLLENEEDFNVNAPDEWNVELLTVGDIITPDMWGYNGIFFDVSKPLTIEDIGEDEGGWWIQLGRSEAPFDLDEINEYLKSKYRVVPYILEESDDDDFNVSASPEWNVTELGVGDIITPDMWDYTKDGDEFRNKIAKSFIINKIFKEDGWDSGWGVSIVHYIPALLHPKFPQTNTLGGLEYGLGELNSHLKPQYKIFIPGALNENEEDFNVSAPSEWNEEYWDDYEGEEEDIYNNFQNFVYRVLKKREVEDEFIEAYLDEIFHYGDTDAYRNISSSKLIEDFNVWIEAQDSDSDWYANMNESDDDFNVSAPESWWEYDGDIEIMFQDTYWYEDENGKEAIVERDGGGILNINDLKQYSYSGWIPFTGNPTSENLNKWYSSIDWDTDLIEIFGFDDSIFEVEEDFDWSTAENVDMDRTGFMIRAISTLKEVEDEFTVKPSKKWDVIYLNKGDFLDNTNSTFTDQNVKYKIGNITSDGEIEVKKYINRGNGFEPQFDRFMKTRKGIVKAKLKPGFDIETSSK